MWFYQTAVTQCLSLFFSRNKNSKQPELSWARQLLKFSQQISIIFSSTQKKKNPFVALLTIVLLRATGPKAQCSRLCLGFWK